MKHRRRIVVSAEKVPPKQPGDAKTPYETLPAVVLIDEETDRSISDYFQDGDLELRATERVGGSPYRLIIEVEEAGEGGNSE